MNYQTVDIKGETLELLPEKAIFWRDKQILFLSDLHLGKAATFRSAGIPVPHGNTEEDLLRLTDVVRNTDAKKLIILGDLFHARSGRVPKTLAAVEGWRKRHSNLEIMLVRGNHDKQSGDPPLEWRFECVNEPYSMPPFVCMHHAKRASDDFIFQGHIHPKILIKEFAGTRKFFPCFFLEKSRLILPAFGSFTGGFEVKPKKGDSSFPVIDGEVLKIEYNRL